nr:MAG TPA: hypothetical protein [Crassvirales sp.]
MAVNNLHQILHQSGIVILKLTRAALYCASFCRPGVHW